jgi:hypothetical protein
MISQRLPTIYFVVGLIAADIAFRLTAYSTYRIAALAVCVLAGLLYLVSGSHELIRDVAFPLVGGLAAGGAIKIAFETVLG